MALIQCPECGKEISSLAPACIHCGYPLPQNAEHAAESDREAVTSEVVPETDSSEKRETSIKRLRYSYYRFQTDRERNQKIMNIVVKVWMVLAAIFVVAYLAIEVVPSMLPKKCAGCHKDLSDIRSFSYAGDDYCASCYAKEVEIKIPCSRCGKKADYYMKSSNRYLCKDCYEYEAELNRILSGG